MYYLETSAIRSLSPYLTNEKLRLKSFTSILTLIELLSQIKDEESFHRTKKNCINILDSKIKIDGLIPELKLANAFGLHINFYSIESLFGLIGDLICCRDFSQFVSLLKSQEFSEIWRFINVYDKNGTRFPSMLTNFQKSYNEIHRNNPSSNEMFAPSSYKELLSIVVDAYKSIVFKNFKEYHSIAMANQLRYNYSLDLYLLLIAKFTHQKLSTHNLAGRNDYFDIHHSVYLNSITDQFVSSDRKMLDFYNSIYPDTALSVTSIISSLK